MPTIRYSGKVYGDLTGSIFEPKVVAISNTLSQVSASNISGTNIVGNFSGSGANLNNLTASGISNFTTDVRNQFIAGTNITINNGVISSSSGVTGAEITGALLPYATLAGVSGTFVTPSQVTSSLTSSNISNFTTDVRSQFSAGANIGISSGVISLSSSVSTTAVTGTTGLSGAIGLIGQLTSSTAFFQGNITVNGTASVATLNTVNQNTLKVGDKYITILSGGADHVSLDGSGILWGSGSTGPTVGPLGENANILFDGINDRLNIFPALYSATASFVNLSSSAVTGTFSGSGALLNNITSSGIVNFTSDVRKQLSGSQYITYNTSSGVISLPFTGSIIGTTPVILGMATSSLTGLTSISASQLTASSAIITTLSASEITASNEKVINSLSASQLTASFATANFLSASVISASTLTVGGGGFSFANSSPSNDSRTLDDYREGTWIPALSGANMTFAYTTQLGRYTKIGNMVICHGTLALSNRAGGISTAPIFLDGLPFTSSNDPSLLIPLFSGEYANFSNGVNSAPNGYPLTGTIKAQLIIPGNNASSNLTYTNLTTTSRFSFGLTYYTNQ